MKSNQKGFTLIELLAVIVILAIIALIATPIILGIVENARKNAAADSLYGVMEAMKLTYTESLLETTTISLPLEVNCTDSGCKYSKPGTTSDEKLDLKFSGTKPTLGTITLEEAGTFADATGIKINGFTCSITSGTASCN